MKERPILFSGQMVRAILEGRKTQTRRIVTTAKDKDTGCELAQHEIAAEANAGNYRNCRYGQPGDRLWVRETWGVISHGWNEHDQMVDWIPDRPATPIHEMRFGRGYYSGHVIYAADGSNEWPSDDDGGGEPRSCWRPSIHMPRQASRITLEITSVHAERLNDISEADAKAEGAPLELGKLEAEILGTKAKYRSGFCRLWESINGSGSWDANPIVLAIEFKVVQL